MESYYYRFALDIYCLFPDLANDLKVAGMNSIESADSNDCIFQPGKLTNIMVDFHDYTDFIWISPIFFNLFLP